MDDAIEHSIEEVMEWHIGLMLHSAIIYYVQFGKQKLGVDEEVGLVNQTGTKTGTLLSNHAITDKKKHLPCCQSHDKCSSKSKNSCSRYQKSEKGYKVPTGYHDSSLDKKISKSHQNCYVGSYHFKS